MCVRAFEHQVMGASSPGEQGQGRVRLCTGCRRQLVRVSLFQAARRRDTVVSALLLLAVSVSPRFLDVGFHQLQPVPLLCNDGIKKESPQS